VVVVEAARGDLTGVVVAAEAEQVPRVAQGASREAAVVAGKVSREALAPMG